MKVTEDYLAAWPKYRLLNLWKQAYGVYSFCLFNVFYGPDFCGVVIFNFGLEIKR